MVDHQVAHVYIDAGALEDAREALTSLDGVAAVLNDTRKSAYGIDHPNAGDLVLLADPDAWFQYYWWAERDAAPYYATEMDIHAKPGFDPCELFLGEDGLASLDPTNVSGSHGRVDESACGCYGLGGPATPDERFDIEEKNEVDARAVAPTIADLLGIRDALTMDFEQTSLL